MSQDIVPQDIRDYLSVTGTIGRYSDQHLGSNIRAAAAFLQRTTGRQFTAQTATAKTFTTEGRAYMSIPDLRTATSVTLQSTPLNANSTYWLIPDATTGGSVNLGIQFRPFNQQYAYLSNPEWFDRGLDILFHYYGVRWSTLPNDLVITGNWGWDPYPDDYF